jgi:hypothetical protein
MPGEQETISARGPGKRLTAVLWFVAAALAFIAFGIGFLPPSDPNWAGGAGGLFCLVMGVSAWRRSRPASPNASERKEHQRHGQGTRG